MSGSTSEAFAEPEPVAYLGPPGAAGLTATRHQTEQVMSQHIHTERSAVAALAELGDDEPVIMLNMLRFRATASYPAGSGHAPCTGREAYARYGAAVMKHLQAAGGRPIFRAAAQLTLIGPAAEAWDEVLLVQYPSRAAFLRMISDPDYLAASVHRSAALEDSRLIAMRPSGGG
jgi:uncharacterized protein (DUF1330 family)